MRLTSLRAHNHRNLRDVRINLSAEINAFQGDNGAGKTSILEAIDVLIRGKSFRTSIASNLLGKNDTALRIEATVLDENHISRSFGIQKDLEGSRLWVDGEKVSRQSALSQYLPAVLIHPNVNELVAGGPGERRSYLDWGLFHVEPGFTELYRKYNRLLTQRNAAFKHKRSDVIKATSVPLAACGTEYDRLRKSYILGISEFYPHFNDILSIDSDTLLTYDQGWPESATLETQLAREAEKWSNVNYTHFGPHRADLAVNWNGDLLAKEASRGQQKLLALCLKLTQAYHLKMKAGKTPVLLIDELPAELDRSRISLVLDAIEEIGSQVLISCVAREQIQEHCKSAIKWFHVEHGSVSEMI